MAVSNLTEKTYRRETSHIGGKWNSQINKEMMFKHTRNEENVPLQISKKTENLIIPRPGKGMGQQELSNIALRSYTCYNWRMTWQQPVKSRMHIPCVPAVPPLGTLKKLLEKHQKIRTTCPQQHCPTAKHGNYQTSADSTWTNYYNPKMPHNKKG